MIERFKGYCALCISRCGSIAVVDNGRFVALEPDPSHPTGQALCAKGRAAPELVYHPGRLLHPLKRTRPKGVADPGWERISWDEALDTTAGRLRDIADQHGAESVVFTSVSPSTSAMADTAPWLQRLMRAFGSPNLCGSMELCGWGRAYATRFTYGIGNGVAGATMPDLEHAGCILFWGYNPSLARIAHATATAAALRRGARLIVVDPRRVGFAAKADVWLRARPGTDAALALGIAGVMLERGWYDRDFIRDWTNAPMLVRSDEGRLLTERDLDPAGSPERLVAWGAATGRPLVYDPATQRYAGGAEPALLGEYKVATPGGPVACRTVLDLVVEGCRRHSPDEVEAVCGVPSGHVERAARLLWEARPVAYFAWSGVEQQSSSTQIFRAISLLYALTGSFEAEGGNLLFPSVPTAGIAGDDLMTPAQRGKTLGVPDRPIGPGRLEWVTTDELYTGILERRPYAVRAVVGFGANLLMAHAESQRGRDALAALNFFVHADLFMTPTAVMADIVLPVASPFEREGLKIGFDVSPAAQSLVQLRPRVVAPRGEARGDTEIVFDLAVRLGLGSHFWNGDVDAAYRHQLGPSGVTLETLRAHPDGVRVPLTTRYRKFAQVKDGAPAGFATPSRQVELYSETLRMHGYPPLPVHVEPLVGPRARPDLAARFPLVLTCAKSTQFCESQHRGLPSLRRRQRDPEVELHPDAAAARGIRAGDWVRVETPEGSVRARASLNESLAADVACGQHGWWEACPEIGAPGYDPFGSEGANLNLIIGNRAVDPVSGSVPHRAYLCEIRRAE